MINNKRSNKKGTAIQHPIVGKGGYMTAYAWMQSDVGCVAAYPITPNTITVEKFSDYINSGISNAEYINTESEHSSLSACIGASAAGCRTATCTSSNGLAYMFENVGIVSGLRLPMLMGIQCRSLSAPLNIHCDHSDYYSIRDSGWIMASTESCQDVYDFHIMGFRIAEHKDVRLPIAIGTDGFIITHSLENVNSMEKEDVQKFVGEYNNKGVHPDLLDVKNPITMGGNAESENTYEIRFGQTTAMENSFTVIKDVFKEFEELTGRSHDFFDCYRIDDAEHIIIGLSSITGTATYAVDKLRKEGIKVGIIRPEIYRPFPNIELVEILEKISSTLKTVSVLDRILTTGSYGPLYNDVIAAVVENKPELFKESMFMNYLIGIGGRAPDPESLTSLIHNTIKSKDNKVSGEKFYWGVTQ